MALLSPTRASFFYKKKRLDWSIIMIDHPCDRIESILLALYTFYDFIFMSEDGGINLHTIFYAVHIWVKRPTYVVCGVDLLHIMLSLLISYLTYKWAKDRHANFVSFLKRLFLLNEKFNHQKNIQTWCDGFLVWSFVLLLTMWWCAQLSPAQPSPTPCTSCESKLPDGTPNCALLPNLSKYAFSPILKSTIWFDLIPKG